MSKTALKKLLPSIPELPGVYRMVDINNQAIYIGKAKNLKNRLSQYLPKLTRKNEAMMNLMYDLEYIVTNTESEALVLEAKMVKALQPKFNILLKDDKSFPYIKLRLDSDFPQLVKHRNKNYKIDDNTPIKSKSGITAKSKFFGPFASVKHIDKTIDELQKIFKLRSCNDLYFATRIRPCIQYEIKKCYAPCVGKISKDEYKKLTTQVLDFFAGKNSNLQKKLSDDMQLLSNEMKYEEAAEIRDRIKSLSYIQMKSGTSEGKIEDLDVIAIAEKNDEFCIQLFMYRQGTPLGNTPYFPVHTEEASKSDVLESFLMQFYQNKTPPSEILISYDLENKELILDSLKSILDSNANTSPNKNIKLNTSKSGFKAELIENALYNAELELSKHLKTTAKNSAMLKQIAEILELEAPPNRIEIYDNSHLQGSNAYGAMVVVGKQGFEKKEYRLYSVGKKSSSGHPEFGGDDYQMLREVMRRRLARIKQEPARQPDLMIIDGGKGHLSVCKTIMAEFSYNIPFMCMSKGVDRNSGREQFHIPDKEVFTLDKKLPVMKYLQILRDEAHNFAITNHRKKRSAEISHSILDDIPDIGPKRKKILLSYLGGGKALSDTSLKELSKIAGISTKTAEKIYNYFHAKHPNINN